MLRLEIRPKKADRLLGEVSMGRAPISKSMAAGPQACAYSYESNRVWNVSNCHRGSLKKRNDR